MTDAPPPAEGQAQLAEELGDVLARMGGVLLSVETVDTAVGLVTQLAVETLAGSSGAGVSLVDERGKRSTASSNSLVEQADALQYQLDSGPCLTAWRDRVLVRIDDVATETRWPGWTAAVAPLGVGSMLSAPLVAGDVSIGAIKVYSSQTRAYDAQSERVLHLFAEQAAILLANTQTLSDARRMAVELRVALSNRDVISRAEGVLLAQGAPDEQTAFGMLASAARRSATNLPEVARQLVASVVTTAGERTS
jgi:GAF domain-containing protein